MEKLKIGFFGGCFNPPITTHITIAEKLIENKTLDEVIFVPVGDYYKKQNLAPAIHRYNMLNILCKNINNIEVEDIASSQEKTLYATDTFNLIQEKYSKNAEIYFIMGSDNFQKMPLWKDYNNIINKYKFIVIERQGHILDNKFKNVVYTKISKTDYISSTKIRNMIKNNEDISKWLDYDVIEYIKQNQLY